jgi:mutator protein MutT
MKKVVQMINNAGVIIDNGKVLIIQRASNDSYAGLWELPGGGREPLEKSVDGVKREVKEETGLIVEVIKVIGVFDFVNEKDGETRDHTQINFLVKPVGPIEVKISSEHQNFAWISPDEIDKYNISQETKEIIRETFRS